MAATIVLKPLTKERETFSFDVPDRVRESIKGIACIEGIFDLVELLEEYPTYDYFVEQAFGKDRALYAGESPTRWELYQDGPFLDFLVLYSRNDELLSKRQHESFVRRMGTLCGYDGSIAETTGVVQSELGRYEVDLKSLEGKHEEVPHSKELTVRLVRWVEKLEQERK